jgi:hypothetical protein
LHVVLSGLGCVNLLHTVAFACLSWSAALEPLPRQCQTCNNCSHLSYWSLFGKVCIMRSTFIPMRLLAVVRLMMFSVVAIILPCQISFVLASHSAQPLRTPSSASLRRLGPPFLVAVAAPLRPSAGTLAGAAMAGVRPSTTDTRLDAEVDAWNRWVPGMSVLVWYSTDNVWHERLLIWPGLNGGWQVLSPDDDIYLEVLLPDGSGDVARVIALPDDNSLPGDLVEHAYRFDAYPGQDRLKALLRDGKKEVEAYYGPRSDGLPAPDMVLTPLGVRKSFVDFFGGNFLTRRLGVKKAPQPVGINRSLVEHVPIGPPGVPPPAGSPPGISSWPSAFDWLLPHLGPFSEAPVGCVWIASETMGSSLAGTEVFGHSVATSFCLGASTLMVQRGDSWQKCELVRYEDVPDYVKGLHHSWEDRLLSAGAADRLKSALSAEEASGDAARLALDNRLGVSNAAPAAEESGDAGEDVRTLEVCYDERGKRFRPWRDVVRDITENAWPDSPHDGPSTVVDNVTHMERYGGTPRLWLQLWARARGVEEGDRVHHELSCLVEILEIAGTYDQINIGSLACMEECCRRLQAIVDAFSSDSGRQDWGNARIFTGRKRAEDLVSPSLKAWAAKKGKEEVELFRARNSLRDLRSPSAAASDEAAAAAASGSLPPGGKGTKGKPKKRGKPLLAPAPEDP